MYTVKVAQPAVIPNKTGFTEVTRIKTPHMQVALVYHNDPVRGLRMTGFVTGNLFKGIA